VKILAIDTSTDICGIALTEDQRLIVEYRSNIRRAHAETVIYAIDHVLGDAKQALHQIDGIAVSIGPGSFTGLRIGLAVVKGLAFSTNLPVVSVPSLDALVHLAYFWQGAICPLVKAQGDEAYTALYHFHNGKLVRDVDYQVIRLDALGSLINQPSLIINVGMKNLADVITDDLKELVTIAPSGYSMTLGYYVARLGFEKFARNEIADIESLEPFYLKDFKAKVKRGL